MTDLQRELAECPYVPGKLDETAPPRVWLQIDTTGDNDVRDEPFPGPEHVTWQDEEIGGLEVQYIRADLVAQHHAAIAGAVADKARLDYIEGCNGRTLREACDKYMARDAKERNDG